MNNNKTVIIISVITLAIVICLPSSILVVNSHKEKLYNSLVLKITEAAKKCVVEEKCQNEKVFLKELYDNKYISKLVNPISKKYISEDAYVIKKEGKFQFIDVE